MLHREDLIVRICQRLGVADAPTIERIRRSGEEEDLLSRLMHEGVVSPETAHRIEAVLEQVQARLGSVRRAAPPSLPPAIEVGGMRFDLIPDSDPYARLPVCRMRCDSFDRRVIFVPLSDPGLVPHEIEERIERVKAKAPPEASRIYGLHTIEGYPHLLVACPDGAPLSVVIQRIRPDRAQSLVMIDALLDALGRAHQAGLVHGYLTLDSIHLSTSGGLEISDYVRTTTDPAWSIAAGPIFSQPPASPRRDVYAAAYAVHALLRLEPPLEALRATLADNPPLGLLVDLLRSRNPSQSEVFLETLARALLPIERSTCSIQELREALLARPARPAAANPPVRQASAPGRRRGALSLLATLLALGATLTAPLWYGPLAAMLAPGDEPEEEAAGPIEAVEPAELDPEARPATPASTAVPAILGREVPPPPPSYLAVVEDIAPVAESVPDQETILASYDEAVHDFPEEPRVHFDRARLLFRLGRFGEALADLDRSIQLAEANRSPSDQTLLYDAYIQKSLTSYELGRPEAILPDLVRAKELLPDRHEAYFVLGRLFDRAGRHETATELFEGVLSAGDPTFLGHYHRGVSRFYAGDLEGAESDLQRALELGGESAGPWCFLGRVRAEQGRRPEAREYLAKAIAIDREAYEAHFYLGKILFEDGSATAAGEEYLAALRIDPTRPGAYNGLALLEEAAGRHDKALALFEKALTVQPQYAPALRNRASLYFHRGQDGDLPRAIADLERSLRIEPEDIDVLVLLGNALAQSEDPAGAVRAYGRAIEIDPRSSRAYYNRGMLYVQNDNKKAARNDFAQAADFDLAYDLPRIALGQIALEYGDHREALDWFQAAIAIHPKRPESHNLLGATLTLLGRLDEAVRAFDRALELAPDDPRALGNRARCLARLHRYGEARRDFDRSLELDPDQEELAAERQKMIDHVKALGARR